MARNRRKLREIFHVEAERMEYYYALADEMPEPLNGIIGYVLNDTCDGVRLALEVDDEYLKQQNSVFPLLYIDPENYTRDSRIIITAEMARQLMKKDPEVIFGIWHEVGHFHTMEEHLEEYLAYADRSQTGYSADHYIAIINGTLLPYEAAADAFAVDYCGQETSVIAINGMISRAKKNPITANNRGMIQELLNRKNIAAGRGKENNN